MSDASEVKRFIHWFGPDYDGSAQFSQEVVLASDFDRIVADLRIKIRSLNLEIETRAKPTVEKLKNEITNLKAEIVRLSRPVSAVCTKCGYDKPANLYEQTIARQAKVIEKLEKVFNFVKDAQCECSISERQSGHLVGCWKPEFDQLSKEVNHE